MKAIERMDICRMTKQHAVGSDRVKDQLDHFDINSKSNIKYVAIVFAFELKACFIG